MSERVPQAFVRVLEDLSGWLESARIPAMVVGGVAASTWAARAPRATSMRSRFSPTISGPTH